MENKYLLSIGGRVVLSAHCEGRIETTSCNQTKNSLKRVGLDTLRRFDLARHALAQLSAAGTLNQRGIL